MPLESSGNYPIVLLARLLGADFLGCESFNAQKQALWLRQGRPRAAQPCMTDSSKCKPGFWVPFFFCPSVPKSHSTSPRPLFQPKQLHQPEALLCPAAQPSGLALLACVLCCSSLLHSNCSRKGARWQEDICCVGRIPGCPISVWAAYWGSGSFLFICGAHGLREPPSVCCHTL